MAEMTDEQLEEIARRPRAGDCRMDVEALLADARHWRLAYRLRDQAAQQAQQQVEQQAVNNAARFRDMNAEMERLRAALDYIDGHGCDDDSRIAERAWKGEWQPPGCCKGH